MSKAHKLSEMLLRPLLFFGTILEIPKSKHTLRLFFFFFLMMHVIYIIIRLNKAFWITSDFYSHAYCLDIIYVWSALEELEYKILKYLQHKGLQWNSGMEQLQTHSDETSNEACMKSALHSLQRRFMIRQRGFNTK